MADEMSKCETTIHNSKMSIAVLRTPICHPEPAGEGIEYTWGCAKQYYRNLNINRKRGVDKFRESVAEALSSAVLSKARIRKFSRQARRYILSYYVFENLRVLSADAGNSGLDEISDFLKEEGETVTPQLIERMAKAFKGHRCALDFDKGFINACLQKDCDAIKESSRLKKETALDHKPGTLVETH